MNQRCPRCGESIRRSEYLRFLWFVSIECPRCDCLLRVDLRGRATLRGGALASIAMGAVLGLWIPPSVAYPVAVVSGTAAATIAASQVGRLECDERST